MVIDMNKAELARYNELVATNEQLQAIMLAQTVLLLTKMGMQPTQENVTNSIYQAKKELGYE